MRNFTTKGIGWLIAGGLVCASALPPDNIPDMMGTLLIGVTLLAVYFIKQKFEAIGIAWFVAGGILTAFMVETLLEALFVYHRLGNDISTITIALVIAGICFFIFYRKNKQDIDIAVDEIDRAMYPDYMPEEYETEAQDQGVAEVSIETSGGTGASADDEVEFEIDSNNDVDRTEV